MEGNKVYGNLLLHIYNCTKTLVNMKKYIVVIAVVVGAMVSSCTQRTCPTYTKGLKKAPAIQQAAHQAEKKV